MAQKYLTTKEIQAQLDKIYELEKLFVEFREEVEKHFQNEHLQIENEILDLRNYLISFKKSTEEELFKNKGKIVRAIKELKSE